MENLHVYKGYEMLVFGLVIIANQYIFRLDPWIVFGLLIAVGGLSIVLNPKGCCASPKAVAPERRKKR
ncbi:hypothetical protein HYU11_03580 [Candidatus Woesearchaeota archaeon]|nr:hypothetical protein [Candidatus Woesearchaeota archaeon]